MAQDGMIILDLDEATETNHMTIFCEHCDLAPAMKEEWITIQFGSFEPVMLSLMVPTTLMRLSMRQIFLMKTLKDGCSSLDESLGSKGRFNHPHSIEERVTLETRNLDPLRGKRSPILIRGMKFNQSICLNKNPLSLSH